MLKNLLEKRNAAIAAARTIAEKADAEKRSMTAEERQNYDRAMTEQAEIKGDIERVEAREAVERDLATSRGRQTESNDPSNGNEARGTKSLASLEYRGQKIEGVHRLAERSSEQYNKSFRNYISAEKRVAASFANDIDADGGYLHAPYQFVMELIKALDNAVFIRKYARVLPVTTTDSLGIPTMTVRPGDADWTSEVGTITPDATAQFGVRQLVPSMLTKEIDVSMKLLATAAISPESIITSEFASIFGRTEEKAFLTGTGSGQPLGLYTASANGISTGRDVVCGSSTAITFDGLQDVKMGLKAQYRADARWNFSRTAIGAISKLKDTTNQYIWQPSKQAGEPDRLLGLPVDESEYTPATFTTGLYVGGLFNYQFYWIADLMGLQVQRLNELLARNNKVGFIGRKHLDAQPVLEEAFVRCKLA